MTRTEIIESEASRLVNLGVYDSEEEAWGEALEICEEADSFAQLDD